MIVPGRFFTRVSAISLIVSSGIPVMSLAVLQGIALVELLELCHDAIGIIKACGLERLFCLRIELVAPGGVVVLELAVVDIRRIGRHSNLKSSRMQMSALVFSLT